MTACRQPDRADVVVVGSGVVGLSAAIALAERNLTVVLVSATAIGGEQSRSNLGLVRQQLREAPELALSVAARLRWQALATSAFNEMDWAAAGHLSLAEDEATVERYRRWMAIAAEFGVPVRLLCGESLGQIAPAVRGSAKAGLFTPHDAHVEPSGAMNAMARTATRLGVRMLAQCWVQRIEHAGGAVTGISTRDRLVRADAVVCAAGLGSPDLLRPLGVNLPVVPAVASLGITEPVGVRIAPSVWRTGGVGLRQRPDGRLAFGLGGFVCVDARLQLLRHPLLYGRSFANVRSTTRVRVGRPLVDDIERVARRRPPRLTPNAEPTVHAAHLRDATIQLARLLGLAQPPAVSGCWAGVIDATPDGRAIIDGTCGPKGLVVAAGTSGSGFGLGPGIGDVVAKVVDGVACDVPLGPFALGRFSRRCPRDRPDPTDR